MDVDNVTIEVYTITEDRTAGVLYLISSFLFFVAAVFIFGILISSCHLRQQWTYQILLNIFAINIFQLLIHFLSGIMNISQSNFHYWLDKTAGAALTTTVNVEVLLLFVFAINRFQVITNGPLFYYISDNFVYKLLICLSYLIGLFFFVSHMTPYTGFSFSRLCNCWIYFEGPFTSVVMAADRFVSLTVVVFTLSLHSYVFVYCLKNRIFTTRLTGEQKNERNLFVVAGLMFIYAFTLIVIHCFADGRPDNSPKFVIYDMFWITYTGTFQILHFAFNSDMISRVKRMFCIRKASAKPIVMKRADDQ